jgi:hypothetical protein
LGIPGGRGIPCTGYRSISRVRAVRLLCHCCKGIRCRPPPGAAGWVRQLMASFCHWCFQRPCAGGCVRVVFRIVTRFGTGCSSVVQVMRARSGWGRVEGGLRGRGDVFLLGDGESQGARVCCRGIPRGLGTLRARYGSIGILGRSAPTPGEACLGHCFIAGLAVLVLGLLSLCDLCGLSIPATCLWCKL